MKITDVIILCSISLLCCCSQINNRPYEGSVIHERPVNVLVADHDGEGRPTNCVDEDKACKVYDIFLEYVENSKKRESVLQYFSVEFRDHELDDLLNSSDANIAHNINASMNIFYIGSRVNTVYSHHTECDAVGCRLSMNVSAGPKKLPRKLLIDYIFSANQLPLINHITVDLTVDTGVTSEDITKHLGD